jgi:hypothetical protein
MDDVICKAEIAFKHNIINKYPLQQTKFLGFIKKTRIMFFQLLLRYLFMESHMPQDLIEKDNKKLRSVSYFGVFELVASIMLI